MSKTLKLIGCIILLALVLMGLLFLVSAIMGCATDWYEIKQPQYVKFHETIQVGDITYHFVSDRSMIPYSGIADGLHYQNWTAIHSIYIVCEMVNGKIYQWSYWIGGHEFQHYLNTKYPEKFGNPDTDPREWQGSYRK